VEADGELAVCRNGVHACRPHALSRWLADELWEVAVDQVELEQEGVLLARRGRLVRRLVDWNADTRRQFATWCLQRAGELAERNPGEKVNAMVDDIELMTREAVVDAPLVAFCTSKVAVEADPGGAAGERVRQSEWLADHLGLTRWAVR
jgi:hypothetical protein